MTQLGRFFSVRGNSGVGPLDINAPLISHPRDLEFSEVYMRTFRFTLEAIAGELTDRFTTKDLRSEFDRAAFVEDLVIRFIDDGGITRRHGIESAIGKKLEDDFRTLARTVRNDITLPLAVDIVVLGNSAG